MKTVKIGDRVIGGDNPCYIIAEAGSNHNGKLEQAKKLIDVAADAKADAVKFQIFKGDELSADKKIQEFLKKIEFIRKRVSRLTG